MVGLSTSWKTKTVDDGDEMLDSILESGFSAIELEYRISEQMRRQIWKRLKSSEFEVLSVHNIFPLPEGVTRQDADADFFLFSSPDHEQRNLAIEHGLRTLHYAADLEAAAVVFHLGRVDMDEERETIWKMFDENEIATDAAIEWRMAKLEERSSKCGPALDAMLLSLDRLHEEAVRLGLIVGIENRIRFNQIPFMDEFEIIFKEFAGGVVRYWHDCGHGEVLQRYGFLDHEKDLLAKYREHLGGIHLHDVLGRKDHLAPGLGELDFRMIAKYLNSDSIKILEVHETATREDLQSAIQLLHKNGIQ